MTPFGRAVRKARKGRSWSQAELAERIGVSQVTVSHWERGEVYPTFEHLASIANAIPEVLEHIHAEELEILRRLMRAERIVFSGACSCRGCGCVA